MSAHDDKGGGPRRYWLLAGGGLLLLLAVLGLLYFFRKAPRPTPQETPDENPATGGVASLRGWVEDEGGFRVAGARVLAFDSRIARGPASPCASAGADSHLFSQSCPEARALLEHLVDSGGLVPRPLATATSDARGDFTLRMPGGSYHLLAEVRGRPVAVARELGPGLSRVRMAVTATVNLSGRVVDAAGGGVPHARVTVVALEPLRLLHELETDETGTFLVAGLLPQPRFGLWARAKKGPSGHAVAEVDAATQKVELVLGPPE